MIYSYKITSLLNVFTDKIRFCLLFTLLNLVYCLCSDDRSAEVFKRKIESATQMKAVLGADPKPNCLVIDEIDGAPVVSH